MRCCTLTFILIGVLMVVVTPAFANIGLGDHEHQRDLPASAMELVVYDPATMEPLKLPGPDGHEVFASTQQVPWGSIVLVNPVVDLGERRLDRVEIRVDMEVVAVIHQPPFTYTIDTLDLLPGRSHTVQALVIRTDRRYTSAFEKFWLDTTPLEAYRPKSMASSVQPEDPLLSLTPVMTEQIFFCSYDEVARVEKGDQLVARMNGRVVGLLEVTRLDRFGYNAKLIAGEAPPGVELYFRNGGRSR